MKLLSDFMKTVESSSIADVENMRCVEDRLGHKDRVDAIDKFLSDKKDAIEIHEDGRIAKSYASKMENCKTRKIDFLLSFSEYKKLYARKACYYTGIELTNTDATLPTQRTIDRVDSNIGYTKENCVTCSNLANSIKNAVLENPSTPLLLTKAQFKRMASKL